jgi:hypothetical protein
VIVAVAACSLAYASSTRGGYRERAPGCRRSAGLLEDGSRVMPGVTDRPFAGPDSELPTYRPQ